MLVSRTVNTYLAVLIIAVVGAGAAHIIIQVAHETYDTSPVWTGPNQTEYLDLQKELLE